METEPALCLNEPISQEQKDHFRPDAGEETIRACYDLISSGHPLSEILVALKQLGPLDKQRQSERGPPTSDTQIRHVAGEVRDAAPQASRAAQQRFISVAASFALGYAAALLVHRRP